MPCARLLAQFSLAPQILMQDCRNLPEGISHTPSGREFLLPCARLLAQFSLAPQILMQDCRNITEGVSHTPSGRLLR